MIKPYIERTIEKTLDTAAAGFPAIVLTGPRQSGKTTVLQRVFGESHEYVSLDAPDVRELALADPRAFLDLHPPPVILDEVQQTPLLLNYIKVRIDIRRDEPAQFVLSGSQNLLLLSTVTESLAGRAAILHLLPLSLRELAGDPHRADIWERPLQDISPRDGIYGQTLWEAAVRGLYPQPASDAAVDTTMWNAGYLQTYLERDVRSLRQIGDLEQFRMFMQMLAARNGQLLNYSGLATELGLAVNTMKTWLSLLVTSFQVVLLRPYHANVGKRLTKTPKAYFVDPGMVCYLVGLVDPEHAARGPMGGAIMESLVLGELLKSAEHTGSQPRISFWRTAAGEEVDFLVERSLRLVPLEVKLSGTPNPRMAGGIRSLRRTLGAAVQPGFVVHPGTVRLPLGEGDSAVPISSL